MVESPILIVDDDELQLRTFKSILEGEGHPVMASTTGAAALKMAERVSSASPSWTSSSRTSAATS